RHRPGHLQEDRADTVVTAAAGIRVRAPAAVVHAVPHRARRLDDRAGGRRPVPVLVRLPASRRWPRPAGPVRVEPRGCTRPSRRPLLFGELRRHDARGPGGNWWLTAPRLRSTISPP